MLSTKAPGRSYAKFWFSVIATMTVLGAGRAAADPSARAAIERFERGGIADKYYLIGIGAGLSWANATLFADHKQRLFCVPEKVALAPEQEFDILKRYVQDNPLVADKSVGAVLLSALADAFPCTAEPNHVATQKPEEQSATTLMFIERWLDANSRCRGGAADAPTTAAACAERQRYDTSLNLLGQCYGKRGQIGADMAWHPCGPDSLR
ncbi:MULTISPECIES: hypothetical protein [unclassified Bradyrhizobium]|uniref:hypothetical protein n=1 Tax=unclassified Bradyrhizobium TaxID=2631580 RepID=UPI0028E9588C|nr:MULTISPECIES: hypothetical protein [unclassified Bradyrhizobium]